MSNVIENKEVCITPIRSRTNTKRGWRRTKGVLMTNGDSETVGPVLKKGMWSRTTSLTTEGEPERRWEEGESD